MSKYIYLTSKVYSFTSEQNKTYTGENHYVAEIYAPDSEGFMPEPRLRKCRTDVGAFKAVAGEEVLLDVTTEFDRKNGVDVPKWVNIRHAKK